MTRCVVRVASGVAIPRKNVGDSFRPLCAGGDIAARCPYQNQERGQDGPRRHGASRHWPRGGGPPVCRKAGASRAAAKAPSRANPSERTHAAQPDSL